MFQLWANIVVKLFSKGDTTRRTIAILFCLFSVVLIEETYIASARNAYRNFYRRTVPAIIYESRSNGWRCFLSFIESIVSDKVISEC